MNGSDLDKTGGISPMCQVIYRPWKIRNSIQKKIQNNIHI